MELKNLLIKLMVMAALSPIISLQPAYAYVLDVQQISDQWYSGVDNDGNKYTCYLNINYDNSGNAIYRAGVTDVIPAKKNVELPEKMRITDGSLQNSTMDLKGCSLSSSMVTITVPATYNSVEVQSGYRVILKGANPPSISVWNKNETYFIVPANALAAYRQKQSNQEDGWDANVKVVPDNYSSSWVTVTASAPGNLLDDLKALLGVVNYDDLDDADVYQLKVIGSINGRDLNVIDHFSCLFSLDLSEATGLEVMRNCANKPLETVILPTSIKEIEKNAFQNCRFLTSINLESIEKIGQYAFSYCTSLNAVEGDKIESIGDYAFQECSSLEKVSIPSIKYVGYWAFANTGLKKFTIYDGVNYDDHMLFLSNVEKLYFHTNRSFHNVNNLPCLTDVYLYDPIPGSMWRDDSAPKIARLHVPGFSYDSFIDNPNYYGFDNVVKLEDNLTLLNVYDDITIANDQSLASKFDVILRGGYDNNGYYFDPKLTNNCPSTLDLGEFTQYYVYGSSTFINNGPMSTNKVKVVNYLNSNSWNFISLPFDVNVKDIVTPEEALWVVRKYDSSIRASRSNTADNADTNSAWVTVGDNSVLKGGQGYILHFSSNNGGAFTFPAASTSGTYFATGTVTTPLTEYKSEFAHNASWNFIGNPFPAYFDSRQMAYAPAPTAPITVWNSEKRTYESFSLQDDVYVLNPFEGFFMQATGAGTEVKFDPEGRHHTREEALARRNAPRLTTAANQDRAIIDISLTSDKGSDRTRLVINEAASSEYEIGRDAAKFMSTVPEVPQIFMLEQDQRMAINERPLGEGVFPVGVLFGTEGLYTISSQSRNSEYSVTLIDAEAGSESDITESDYSFFAKEGVAAGRFSIRLSGGTDSVAGISDSVCEWTLESGLLTVAAKGAISVYSIDGRLIASATDSLETQLPNGVFVIKAAGKTVKVTH